MALTDVGRSMRRLRRQPGFALLTIGSLGLGIGAATAVFALVQAVLLQALPFADPDRLVWMYNARTERERAPFSIPDLEDYQRDAATLDGLAPFTNWTANLTGAGDPERLEGVRVGEHFFDVLGASAQIGRVIRPEDAATDARVVVITSALWKRRFDADAAIVGRFILLNGAGYEVAGVLPDTFVFPFRDAQVAVPLPLASDPRRADRGANFLRVVARLKAGVSLAQAKANLDTIARRLQQTFPDDDARKIGVNLFPLHAEIVSDYRHILWSLLASVLVVVTIGCANVAGLLLVRASTRRGEFILQLSLGASRGRLARELMAEAVWLVTFGGLAGLFISAQATAAWRAYGPPNFPRMALVSLGADVFAFAIVVTAATAIICGLVPAWTITGRLDTGLRQASAQTTLPRRHAVLRRTFVAVQLFGCAILLVCTALAMRGLATLTRTDPGFSADGAVTVQLSLPPARYKTRGDVIRLHQALDARLRAAAGARAIGVVSLLPLSGLLSTTDIAFPDRPAPPPTEVPQAHFRVASSEYFAAAGIPILDGREFDIHDATGARPVAIVNRTLAERHWPGRSAVGQHISPNFTSPSPSKALEIVGVAADVKQAAPDGPATADLYVPLLQMPSSQTSALVARMNWVVRSDEERSSLERRIRDVVRAADPDIAASTIHSLEELLAGALASRRMNVRLLEVFGQFGIAIVALGVYGLAAFSVGTRRRELAIRACCGARRADLAWLVLRDELGAGIGGIAAGLLAAGVVAPAWIGRIFEVSGSSPFVYVAIAVGLVAVTTAAVVVPAYRAGGADPRELLRT